MTTPSASLKETTPDAVAAMLGELTQEQLSKLSHSLLLSARARVPAEQQNKIASAEHRAFAREAVIDNPLMAASLTAAIPAYQLYKLLNNAIGTGDAPGSPRSDPSITQLTQGFTGIGEGLSQSLSSLFK